VYAWRPGRQSVRLRRCRSLASAGAPRYNRPTSMTERRSSDDDTSGAPKPTPAADSPLGKGKAARTLPLGSVTAEVRARIANAVASPGGTPEAARPKDAKSEGAPLAPQRPLTSPRPSPFPDERTVKRPYPTGWDEATSGGQEDTDAHPTRAPSAPEPSRSAPAQAPPRSGPAPASSRSPYPHRDEASGGAYRVPSPYPQVSARPERPARTVLVSGTEPPKPTTPPVSEQPRLELHEPARRAPAPKPPAGGTPLPADPRTSASPLPPHLISKARNSTASGALENRARPAASATRPPTANRLSDAVQLQLDQRDLAPVAPRPSKGESTSIPSGWIALGIVTAMLGLGLLLWLRLQSPEPAADATSADPGSAPIAAPTLVAPGANSPAPTGAPGAAAPATPTRPASSASGAQQAVTPPITGSTAAQPPGSSAVSPVLPAQPAPHAPAANPNVNADPNAPAHGGTPADQAAELLKAGEPPEQPDNPASSGKPSESPAAAKPKAARPVPAAAATKPATTKPAEPTRESRESRTRKSSTKTPAVPAETKRPSSDAMQSIENAREALKALENHESDEPPAPPADDDEPPAP
jgi:hypothetical protein